MDVARPSKALLLTEAPIWLKGEQTLVEVSLELDIQPTAIRQWRTFEVSEPSSFARRVAWIREERRLS